MKTLLFPNAGGAKLTDSAIPGQRNKAGNAGICRESAGGNPQEGIRRREGAGEKREMLISPYSENFARRVAVIFPGLGYTCDRSLLYFASRIATRHGYEVVRIDYGKLPEDAKNSMSSRKKALELALHRSRKQLVDAGADQSHQLLFISKSIGTVVSNLVNGEIGGRARSVLFTPLKETFERAGGEYIVFHGTGDPWAPDLSAEKAACLEAGHEFYTYSGANHSLETGDVMTDIENLADVMRRISAFIERGVR